MHREQASTAARRTRSHEQKAIAPAFLVPSLRSIYVPPVPAHLSCAATPMARCSAAAGADRQGLPTQNLLLAPLLLPTMLQNVAVDSYAGEPSNGIPVDSSLFPPTHSSSSCKESAGISEHRTPVCHGRVFKFLRQGPGRQGNSSSILCVLVSSQLTPSEV